MMKQFMLNDQEFKNFSQIIEQYAGIHMAEGKKALVEGRLRKRLVALNLETYNDYYKIVRNDNNKTERQLFIDLLTTNETWFFREENHFNFLKKILDDRNPQQPMNIWSAACSSGQEPYSIAMLMAEERELSRPWNILGTDISNKILTSAKKGVYLKKNIKGLSKTRVRRFMLNGVRSMSEYLAIVPELKKRIDFQPYNLTSSPLPSIKYDVIFCRNVLIYFDNDTKKKVIDRLIKALKTEGYLFTGHSESLHGVYDNLKVINPSIYQRI
ncbi:MAG: SAM-dependent methyltransferase [Gammaproteobacteria bacterium]|nr:SAM-dependent methyltransferase [Gammaproteobacteria bacterium]